MKIAALTLALLVSASSFASYPIHFGKIQNVWPYSGDWLEDLGPYRITKVKVVTTATASGSKLFGKWKNCYSSRYENVPRSPFQGKYIYTSKKTFQDVDVEILGENEILLGNLKASHSKALEELKKETKDKCRIETTTQFVVEFFIHKTGTHLKYQFFITESGQNLVLENHRFNQQGNLVQDSYTLEEGVSQGPIEMATYTYQGSF